jgi:hypothetical protein
LAIIPKSLNGNPSFSHYLLNTVEAETSWQGVNYSTTHPNPPRNMILGIFVFRGQYKHNIFKKCGMDSNGSGQRPDKCSSTPYS